MPCMAILESYFLLQENDITFAINGQQRGLQKY